MSTIIAAERPDTPEARELIAELDTYLTPLYPPGSRLGFSVEQLLEEAVAFFVTRHERFPAGCAGVKLFDKKYGEVKRMYVRPQYRGRGLARLMLDHLADYVRQRGVTVLRLEAGINQPEAIHLYERVGFQRTSPFGPFPDDGLSVYFEKRIA